MQVLPYLIFEGRCEEAVEFYKTALGAEVQMMMRYKDSPDQTMCSAEIPGDKIMHASLRIGETTVMASDGRCLEKPIFKGFSLSLNPPDTAGAERLFTALSDGGEVVMPLMKTFYAESFGMITDRFGVMWMIIVEPK